MGGGDEGAAPAGPGEDDVARLVTDEQRPHDGGLPPIRAEPDHAHAVGQVVDHPHLVVAPRGDRDGLRFIVGDGRRLPFADGSVDVAACSLVIHHLPPDEAVAMLREMRRVARRGVIVNDLIRTWLGLLGAWAVSRALTRNPLTRHDAPLSVRRAYTRAELVELARRAGLGPVVVAGWLGYRVSLTAGGGR